MHVVFSKQDYKILGQFAGREQENDTVYYMRPGGIRSFAFAHEVEVREVSTAEVVAEIDRLKRQMDSAASWVGGDSLTAMNTLVAVGIELTEYARVMGALLSPEAAKVEHDRLVNSGGYYIGARAHSRQFEEVTA